MGTQAAELLFRHKVISGLKRQGLLSQQRIELLMSWQQHTGFSAHNGVTVEPEDPEAVERLARYLLRPALSLERMSFDSQEAAVRYRRKRPGTFASAVQTFDPLDFLARLLMHVPEPRLHTVRYYGRYAKAEAEFDPLSTAARLSGPQERRSRAYPAADTTRGGLAPSAGAERRGTIGGGQVPLRPPNPPETTRKKRGPGGDSLVTPEILRSLSH